MDFISTVLTFIRDMGPDTNQILKYSIYSIYYPNR